MSGPMTYGILVDTRREGDAPDVSVVVATRNRRRLLERLLTALEAQSFPPGRFEVVFADDGSTDGTPGLLSGRAATLPFRLAVIRSEESRGPATARNAAWRVSRGPIVAFTDDDCEPTSRWL